MGGVRKGAALTMVPVLPFPAVWIGLAALVPFLVAAVSALLGGPAWRGFGLSLLLAYGATVLAFLGAVHWGLALARPDQPGNRARLTSGTLPVLAGTAILLLPRWLGLMGLIATLIAVHGAEEALNRAGALPGGYIWMRRLLTLGAVICGAAGLVALLMGPRVG